MGSISWRARNALVRVTAESGMAEKDESHAERKVRYEQIEGVGETA